MDRIVPHLWFDTQAKEAAERYTSILPDSKVVDVTVLHDTPSGDCDVVTFVLAGQQFQAISAGPLFSFNPSISFIVNCDTPDEVDTLWAQLVDGGDVLMPLDSYPFSDRYGWLQDRYGLAWQIIHPSGPFTQKIVPSLLFVGDVCGKAEEAIGFYASVFDDSAVNDIVRYGPGQDPDPEGNVMYASFRLAGYELAAMDSARAHGFSFNEAVSLEVLCDDQAEIDRFWSKLSAVPEAEQCGWLKDRFGVSWQIVPKVMDEMLRTADDEAVARVTKAFLPMKKLDVAQLESAYAGG